MSLRTSYFEATLLLGALAAGCAPSVTERRPVEAPASESASPEPPSASPPEPPSASPSRVQNLAVPGFEPAVLFVPAGSEQRPLVLATHGAGGGPEWECDYWSKLTRGRAFVLCLRGKPIRAGVSSYYYPDHHALERELIAAEQAARSAEPRIAPGSGVYAGFSQGASMGALILPDHVAAFPYVVLIEGFTTFDVRLARRVQDAGGKRILFACGTQQCASVAARSLRSLQVAGVEAHAAVATGAGHTPAGAVMEQVAAALPWLLQGEALWPTAQAP